MKIHLNGQKVEILNPCTVFQLIEEKKIPLTGIVAELNGEILTDFSKKLKEGDILELIRMVGGG